MYKKIPLLLLLVLSLALPAGAREVPDLSRTGSVELRMEFDGCPLEGGSLTLFRVGQVVLSGGNDVFIPVDALGDGPDLSDLSDPALAHTLEALAREKALPPIEAPIAGGKAVFSGLEPGVYVVSQEASQATAGFDAIRPFLLSLPRWEDDGYRYDLTAAPKVPLVPAQTQPTEPTSPTEPSTPPSLPQTGQLNWPVPVLAVLGMSLFAAGWLLCHGRHEHET